MTFGNLIDKIAAEAAAEAAAAAKDAENAHNLLEIASLKAQLQDLLAELAKYKSK